MKNPYWGEHFFQFFQTFFSRICNGEIVSLQPDEIQMGVLALIALACGLIGPFLVLKKMAMFANSLAHTILFGIVAAFLITSFLWGGGMFDPLTLLIGALVAAVLTAALTEGIVRWFRLQEDASVGFVFSTLFALGIVLATMFTRNVHLGVEAVTGNTDILGIADLKLSFWLALLNVGVVVLFYRPLQMASFDRSYAWTQGGRPGWIHMALLFLISLVCIGAFRAVGVLLVLSFLTGPYLTARLFCHRLSSLLIWSPILGIAASFIGVALTRHCLSIYGIPLSTGGMVVSVIGLFYFAGIVLQSIRLKLRVHSRSL